MSGASAGPSGLATYLLGHLASGPDSDGVSQWVRDADAVVMGLGTEDRNHTEISHLSSIHESAPVRI